MRIIYETVVTYVDLIEHNLFSLAILIGELSGTMMIESCRHSPLPLDGEYCFPSMDRKISKLVDDSKWKTGAAAFVMQLKIKYFVTDIAILRFEGMAEKIDRFVVSLRHFLTQHFFYLQFRQMILADTFQISTEQKLSFATLAYQAEYGGANENEPLVTNFFVEHYASNELINQVERTSNESSIVSIALV